MHNPTNKWNLGIKGTKESTKMSAQAATKPMLLKKKMTRKERRAAREVTTLREQPGLILPATTFKRIITQEAAQFSTNKLRFNSDAVRALQTAAEDELTNIFSGAAFCASLGKRDTVTVEDMKNFMALRDTF